MVLSTRDERSSAARGSAGVPGSGQQYLTFMVGTELFGASIESVKEIIEYRRPTDVPMMPAQVRGVINLRGHVVPVIDLSVRFGRPPLQEARRTCIVVVDVEQMEEVHEIGIMVDSVSAVIHIADADIEPAPNFGANLRSDFITGMGKVGEKFVVLLSMDRVLSVEELSALTGIADQQASVEEPGSAATGGTAP